MSNVAIKEDLQDYLDQKHEQIKNTIVSFVYDTGEILNEVQNKLKGTNIYFLDWVISIGISKNSAKRYIDFYNICKDNGKLKSLSQSLVLEYSKNDTPQELKQKVISGEIKTFKELKTMKEKVLRLENEKEYLETENAKLKKEKSKMVEQINNLAEINAKKDMAISNTETKYIAEFKSIVIDISTFLGTKIPHAKNYLANINKEVAKEQYEKAKSEIINTLSLLESVWMN